MATPTPGSASKRPGGGGVSTPSHLNQSSPAPRSVPSPNATRHHPAGKTPVSHPTTGSSHGSKTVSSTPMVHNLSQSGHSVSPGVNTLGTPGLGGMGSGLGIEGITPGALHSISTPLAFAMSRTDSEMRIVNSVTKRNEDDERRVKMRKVLKSIGRPKGRVSEEGIARLARRVGMVSDIDDEKLTQEERDRKVGNRSFSVAGDSVIVTVDLKDQIPQSVEVNGDVAETEEAARVLLHDLKESGDVPLMASLDGFALNLSYLAQMDRLKKETETDCFAAVGGIYRSLWRLHQKEVEAATQRLSAAKARMNVRCNKSGKPVMHARGRLGLRLDYWQQARFPADQRAPEESEMEVDDTSRLDPPGENSSVWTLHVGARKSNITQMPYLPLRVSDQWLPDPLELPSEDSGEHVKWVEPADGHESLSKPCFFATLGPPIALPYATADAILKSFNVQNVPNMQSIPSYLPLLLSTVPDSTSNLQSTSNGHSTLRSTQEVIAIRHGESTPVQYHYTLDNAKPDFGYLLRELPFSHPKQLVELLPILRQWAGFGVLVSQSFEAGLMSSNNVAKESRPSRPCHDKIGLEDLAQVSLGTGTSSSVSVNMALSTTPQPTLNITFRSASSEAPTINIDVQILRNAEVVVEVQDGFHFDNEGAKLKLEARLAKALDVCWDLGIWIEWVRSLKI